MNIGQRKGGLATGAGASRRLSLATKNKKRPLKKEVAQQVLNFEVQQSVLKEIEAVRTSVACLAKTVMTAEQRASEVERAAARHKAAAEEAEARAPASAAKAAEAAARAAKAASAAAEAAAGKAAEAAAGADKAPEATAGASFRL